MTIYKSPDGALHDDMGGGALALPSWPAGAVALTDDEVAALQAPTTADLWADLRSERNALLAASDVLVTADRWAAYSDDERAAMATYRQALRDLPENTTDPAAPVWPTMP